ncbi:peroxisomal carnitine O-octanoyltransferase-like [Chironomus tepperi]|uniref:peroxisomal carnitine O-octanoyltransferase-like n=1 Tax=Chironomus tepperi TaxID=113505 RepID=UPI00391FAC14
MAQKNIFIQPEGGPSTFHFDEDLDNLPLPSLDDTLERYYKSLIPFASDESELKNTERIISEFKNGDGKKLHEMLKEKASKEKNWVENYWEDYAYLTTRVPLAPYCVMSQPLLTSYTGINTTRGNLLRNFSRIVHYTLEFWDLIRHEKLRPGTSADGKMHFSSNQFKRIFNTSRNPGDPKDEISCYFKLKSEGSCPTHIVVIGSGRIFYFDVIYDDKLMSPQELHHTLSIIYGKINDEKNNIGIPILTCDDRTAWSKNRQYLMELSKENQHYFKIIESSIIALSFDDLEPSDISELSQKSIDGDIQSRWHDKSSTLVAFRNGRFGFVGEHSCYDGALSFSPYILMNLMDNPEPDWNEELKLKVIPKEIKFKVDDKIKIEIDRLEKWKAAVENVLTVHFGQFEGYGKNAMKDQKIHPDCFVQMALQLTYYKLHAKLPSTYETATMRQYYHGRTETVRSCSIEVMEWIDKWFDGKSTTAEKAKYFRRAANSQHKLMNDAKQGKGVDRHLFALSCLAIENQMSTPELYNDPLFLKSGGGGNFVLSTSTLGYFINIGFVAPMLKDGYGTFYTMLENRIWIIVTAYKESDVTSGKKFYDAFESSMTEIMDLLNFTSESKL